MENILFKWLYLLKTNNELLKVKVENALENDFISIFENYFLDTEGWVKTLKDYSEFEKEDIEDHTQKKCYKLKDKVPYFNQIKSSLLTGNFEWVNNVSNFDGIKDMDITSWVLHIEWYEWTDIKNIFLFQSFFKTNMYISESFFKSKVSMAFTGWTRWIFKQVSDQKVLNLRKTMDVVYIDDGKVYIYNKKRYDIIFNFQEELKTYVPQMVENIFTNNDSIFSFENVDIDDLILKIKENYQVAKKIYILFRNEVMEGFNLADFKSYVSEEWIMWVNYCSLWKIEVEQAWFDILLDAINGNFFTDYRWEKYLSKSRKKININS